jgi:LAO/AO transport system kinase
MLNNALDKKGAKYFSQGILAGDRMLLSRAITLIESELPTRISLAREIIDLLLPYTGKSFRCGITGVPGAGKSTFIEHYGQHVVAAGGKLAVLAIDPSSGKSRGSILGDKTRMEGLTAHSEVFIRPSPSGGALGGVTRVTYETMLLCEAAGFDYIMVETVGVGQSETAVRSITDFFMLLMLAGAGDELQGIKRGIMEMADAIVITKADGNNVAKARAACGDFARALHLLRNEDWTPKALTCSALTGDGFDDITALINQFRLEEQANQLITKRRQAQMRGLLESAVQQELLRRYGSGQEYQEWLGEQHLQLRVNPFVAAGKWLDKKRE